MADTRDPQPRLTPAEFESLCECNGTAPCGEAQADGVPCDALGRDCEKCGRAVAFHRDIQAADRAAPQRRPADEDPDLVILPTDIGA